MTSEDIEQMKDEIAQLKAKLKGKNEEKEEGQKGAGASKKRRLSNETEDDGVGRREGGRKRRRGRRARAGPAGAMGGILERFGHPGPRGPLGTASPSIQPAAFVGKPLMQIPSLLRNRHPWDRFWAVASNLWEQAEVYRDFLTSNFSHYLPPPDTLPPDRLRDWMQGTHLQQQAWLESINAELGTLAGASGAPAGAPDFARLRSARLPPALPLRRALPRPAIPTRPAFPSPAFPSPARAHRPLPQALFPFRLPAPANRPDQLTQSNEETEKAESATDIAVPGKQPKPPKTEEQRKAKREKQRRKRERKRAAKSDEGQTRR